MNITLIEYEPQFQADFYRLNEAWIAPYFGMEPEDIEFMQNPQSHILDKGGMIFFALDNTENGPRVLGTCGLLKIDERTYELVKIAVDAQAQGLGLGKRLVQHAIGWADAKDAEQLILESSTQPINARAVAMYGNLGFSHYEPAPQHRSALQRADVFMQLTLKSPALHQ